MLIALLTCFGAALLAPWLHRWRPRLTAPALATVPLALAAWFAAFGDTVASGASLRWSTPWVPSLGLELSFVVDGLSLPFVLLISGIGALVVFYSGGYLAGDARLGRLCALLFGFMASMLGVVLCDNLIALFVFWELTSVASYLLIGFDHEREPARAAALQSLLVTGLGGLALLAGFLLLAEAGGSFEISELRGRAESIRSHALYAPALLLILLGAFTKSAQFPFHFWLPNAMAAPTPVSAYLHSATMVKAGVYLVARLAPILGETPLWTGSLCLAGGVTMVVGAVFALFPSDMKRVLAYSTISALGTLTLLIGVGTPLALKAAALFLATHALYKAALFLVAGAVEHETGQRNLDRLSGLGRWMPLTAAAALLAALSKAGVPPLFGFVAKEAIYDALLQQPAAVALLGATATAMVAAVAVAVRVGIQPFWGRPAETPKKPREASASLWIGPLLLSALGLLCAVFPGPLSTWLVAPFLAATLVEPTAVVVKLWPGVGPVLALSGASLVAGATLFAVRRAVLPALAPLGVAAKLGPESAYEGGLRGLKQIAATLTKLLQSGYLRRYVLIAIATTVVLSAFTGFTRGHVRLPWELAGVRFHEAALAFLMVLGAFGAVWARSRLTAVMALGVVGLAMSYLFVLFGAPDLAMTQLVVEVLTVILFVLVFYRLPDATELSSRSARWRDATVAALAGLGMTGLVLSAAAVQFAPPVSAYFSETSVALAHGRNIVNVILVDFRAIDTLGEIIVLAVAGLGAVALLRGARKETKRP